MGTVKSLKKCEVYDETNVGSRRDPKLYVLKFCELVCTTKYLSMCLESCIITVLYYESTKKYICNELYLCENIKCDVDVKLALWANEANTLHKHVTWYL